MSRQLFIAFQLCFLSSLSYADMTVGIWGSFGRILKEIHQPSGFVMAAIGHLIQNGYENSKKIEEEIKKREEELSKIISSGKFVVESRREHNQKIKDLRSKIQEAGQTVQSNGEKSLHEMESELWELLSNPPTMEFKTRERASWVTPDLAPCEPNPVGNFSHWLVPGILAAPIPEGVPVIPPPSSSSVSPVSPVSPMLGPLSDLPAFVGRGNSRDLPDFTLGRPPEGEQVLYVIEPTLGGRSCVTSGEQAKASWGRRAVYWSQFVGTDGSRDPNRARLTDPVVLEWLEQVSGRVGVDIGCGNGYLTRALSRLGARVVGVEPKQEMLKIARLDHGASLTCGSVEYREGSASRLGDAVKGPQDFCVMNFVLMDCKHHNDCIREAYKVLKPGGELVIVIVHPGFPLAYLSRMEDGSDVFKWSESYDTQHKQETTIAGLQGELVTVFHRSLQQYFEVFRSAGFVVEEVVEPHLAEEQKATLSQEASKQLDTNTPISIAFRLRKSGGGPVSEVPPGRPERTFDYSHNPTDVMQQIRQSCFGIAQAERFSVIVNHPFFPPEVCSGTTCTWSRSYFDSVTLSDYCRLFKEAGCEIVRLREEGAPGALPVRIAFELARSLLDDVWECMPSFEFPLPLARLLPALRPLRGGIVSGWSPRVRGILRGQSSFIRPRLPIFLPTHQESRVERTPGPTSVEELKGIWQNKNDPNLPEGPERRE